MTENTNHDDTVILNTMHDIALFQSWVRSVSVNSHELRIWVTSEGIKLKVDNGIWSPGIGESVHSVGNH